MMVSFIPNPLVVLQKLRPFQLFKMSVKTMICLSSFSFDEEQEDGGVNTRLEAFYDVLRYKKKKKKKKDI